MSNRLLTFFLPINSIRRTMAAVLCAAAIGALCFVGGTTVFAQEADTAYGAAVQTTNDGQPESQTQSQSEITSEIAAEGELVEETDEQIAAMIDKKVVRIRILDKITATTRNFNLDVGQTVSYGDLRIKPQACRKSPPTAEPEAAAFLEVWEILAKNPDPQWVFSGWMFASTPGLSAMDHPIYDVWVIDCLDSRKEPQPVVADKPDTVDEKPEDGAPSEEFPDLGD